MAVQRRQTSNTRRSAPAKPAARARKAPAPAASKRKDVSGYANKPATPYHKAFAKWIVEEVGFDPEAATSKRAAFLKGVSIATAARPAFNQSDFIEEWRDRTGEIKRGPKPKDEEEVAPRRTIGGKRATAPVVEEDEFEDDDEEFEDDDEDSDDEFDDDDEDSDDTDEDEFDDDDEEPAPPVKRARPTKTASAPVSRARKGAAPAKAATKSRRPAAEDDDEFLF